MVTNSIASEVKLAQDQADDRPPSPIALDESRISLAIIKYKIPTDLALVCGTINGCPSV